MPKAKRREKHEPFKVPMGYETRTPKGLSPLAEFIESCNGEVSVADAVHEYQTEWCDHPSSKQILISTTQFPMAERYEYTVACGECGLVKVKNGRPSSRLKRISFGS